MAICPGFIAFMPLSVASYSFGPSLGCLIAAWAAARRSFCTGILSYRLPPDSCVLHFLPDAMRVARLISVFNRSGPGQVNPKSLSDTEVTDMAKQRERTEGTITYTHTYTSRLSSKGKPPCRMTAFAKTLKAVDIVIPSWLHISSNRILSFSSIRISCIVW